MAATKEFKRQEAERLAKEKAEKEWWESRKNWIENFPFEPTSHQEIRYYPNVYNAKGSAHWPEEKKDEAYWEMMRRVGNHGFLRCFYSSYLPYSEEFGETDDTLALGWMFETLRDYHLAAQRNPEEIYMENARVENEPSLPPKLVIISIDNLGEEYKSLPVEEQNMLVRELAKDYMKAYQAFGMPSYEVRDTTWRGEEAEKLKECILGALTSNDANLEQPWISEEQAKAIQERLVNEILRERILENAQGRLYFQQQIRIRTKNPETLCSSSSLRLRIGCELPSNQPSGCLLELMEFPEKQYQQMAMH